MYFLESGSGLKNYIKEKFITNFSLSKSIFGALFPIFLFISAYYIILFIGKSSFSISDLGYNSKLPFSNPILVTVIFGYYFMDLVKKLVGEDFFSPSFQRSSVYFKLLSLLDLYGLSGICPSSFTIRILLLWVSKVQWGGELVCLQVWYFCVG